MNNIFLHKKIGIWGFGIVGTSALNYIDNQGANCIEILDKKTIILPATKTKTVSTIQTDSSIQTFLENNDLIFPSPGIKLHNYQKFAHKFINELDFFHDKNKSSIIAITGTIGKTTITHLLETIIKYTHKNTIAAGNIGYPILNLIENKKEVVIMELSSFQLQPIHFFGPDIAIITNFYPNHLDHHLSIDEYFVAKSNILKYQTDKQVALIPLSMIDEIKNIIPIKKNWAFFSKLKPTENLQKKYQYHAIYYLDNKKTYCLKNNENKLVFDFNHVTSITFDENWLIIIATSHLYKIDLATISPSLEHLKSPDHRLQKIGSMNGYNFYNDSKSTVWQATLQAVLSMQNKKIILFLGGLSKGADRTPLIKALQHKNIEVYAFGKEIENIAQLCMQFNIPVHTHATLQESFKSSMHKTQSPAEILLSPGGSSFDLFKNYEERGQVFTDLVAQYIKDSS